MPPLGNLLTLKSLTFRTSFSVFHCLPALSISRVGEAMTKTIPRDGRKLIKLMLRKCTFLPPRSQLIGQFVKRHLVTIRREQHVLAQWLRQYFRQDHGVRSVISGLCNRAFSLFMELYTMIWMVRSAFRKPCLWKKYLPDKYSPLELTSLRTRSSNPGVCDIWILASLKLNLCI